MELFFQMISGQIWVISLLLLYFAVLTRNKRLRFIMVILILNTVFNIVFKHIIRQPRPNEIMCSTYNCGMPSGHCQFIACFFMLFYVLIVCPYTKCIKCRFVFIKFSLLCSFVMVYARVGLEYHTIQQSWIGLFVGTIIGCLFGFLYKEEHFF